MKIVSYLLRDHIRGTERDIQDPETVLRYVQFCQNKGARVYGCPAYPGGCTIFQGYGGTRPGLDFDEFKSIEPVYGA